MQNKRFVRLLIRVISVMILVAVGVIGRTNPAHAGGYFTVNSDVDLVDSNPGDGYCSTLINTCTLRAATMEANRTGLSPYDSSTIIIPKGIFLLTIPSSNNDNDDSTGSLKIKTNVNVIGSGMHDTTIEGNGNTQLFFIGSTTPSSAVVTLNDLTIDNGGNASYGGGIHNNATLTLNNVLVVRSISNLR